MVLTVGRERPVHIKGVSDPHLYWMLSIRNVGDQERNLQTEISKSLYYILPVLR
jgi:hypothetical protein